MYLKNTVCMYVLLLLLLLLLLLAYYTNIYNAQINSEPQMHKLPVWYVRTFHKVQ